MFKPPVNHENDSHGEIKICFNSKKVYAGDKILGQVFIKGFKDIANVMLNGCLVAEEWSWIAKANPQEKDHEQVIEIFPRIQKSYICGNTCPGGMEYRFDIDIVVPKEAPAAIRVDNEKAKGHIAYYYILDMTCNGCPELVKTAKVKVRERFEHKEKQTDESSGTVQGYCYTNKGQLKLGCVVQSLGDLNKVDETIKGELKVDNRGCPYDIKVMRGKLSQKINLQSQGRTSMYFDTIISWDAGAVKGSEQKALTMTQKMPYNEKYACMSSTSKGRLITRSYCLDISPEYETFVCCAPSISIPFEIENLKTHKKKDHKK